MADLVDDLPCGYVSFSDTGVIERVNETLASWLHYPKEEMKGQSIEKMFTLATRIFYNTHFFPLIVLQSNVNEVFLSLKDKNGADIPVLANAERKVSEGASLTHCVFMRVEERKKFEEELLRARREAEKAVSENKQLLQVTTSLERQSLELDKQYQRLTTMNENLVQFNKVISHDLHEPIRKIQIFIEMIGADPDVAPSSKISVLAEKIAASAAKLKLLTEGLQGYIAAENEKQYAEVDLNQVIESAMANAIQLNSFHDFDLDAEKMPLIEGYPKQLHLMLFHLIDNAIKFRFPGRRLVVKIRHVVVEQNVFRVSKEHYRYSDHIRIIFEDNGVGFSADYIDYVFKLLKKLDNASTGLGIGLPLVKRIVQNHSGDIRVSSKPNAGTTFEIELPMKVI